MNNVNNENSMKKILGGIIAVGMLGMATQVIFANTATLVGSNTLLTSTNTTSVDVTAPIISSVRVENITATTAQIKWATDELSDSGGVYNTASVTTSFSVKSRCDNGGNVLQHCVYLTELYPGSKYFYKVVSRNAAGLTSHAYGDFLTIQQSGTTANILPATTSTQTGTVASTATTSTPSSTQTAVVPAPTVIAPTSSVTVLVPSIVEQPTPVVETPASNEPTTEPVKPAESTVTHIVQTSIDHPAPAIHLPAPAEVTQKLEPIKTKLSIKNPGNISDREEVHVKVNQSALGVEMRLARKESKESLYLGQAQYDPTRAEWVFHWDSTQTPDGAYTIASVITTGNEAVVQGDVKTVVVKNEKGAETNNSLANEHATSLAREVVRGGAEKRIEKLGVLATGTISANVPFTPVSLITPEKYIEKIIKERQQKEDQIINDIVGVLISPDIAKGEAANHATQPAAQAGTTKKIEELKNAISEGDTEKKKAIIAEMVSVVAASSGGVASEAVQKNVEEKVAKLEQVAEEQKTGVVDTKNFSVDAFRVAEVATKPDGTQSASKIEFKGKALPNSFATLYIHSIPIVVTIKTDKDGYWNYTLDKELENGKHQVYVAITDVKGTVVAKSSPVPFIKEASAVTLDQINTAPAQQDAPSFVGDNYLYGSIIAIVLIIVAVLILLGLKSRETPQP